LDTNIKNTDTTIYKYITQLNFPSDLKKIAETELPIICEELRQFIIDSVSQFGGHLGASLGTVELTVALHYLFDTPNDLIVWDVGHQAYGHKILTGRRDRFHTNRRYGGISGFPQRQESIYDAFGTGHSSTSISAALGMAVANQGTDKQHIAVIGDGAMTAGMVFEALNNAGTSRFKNLRLLIILNDNGMSIDTNVGALHEQFQKKPLSNENNLFTALQIPYFGKIDGHNLTSLIQILEKLKNQKGVKVLHIQTIKGKGYHVAEDDQVTWHAPHTFNKVTGKIRKRETSVPQPPKYQDVFGETLVELASQNPQILGVTPAMLSGSSMRLLARAFPARTFDVGIAEQHAVTFSAGLATQGYLPFCNIYSTFIQRAYDQVVHDVCVQKLRVVFCLDRAGLVGADGATHHGAFDLAFFRCLPNLIIAAPMHEIELRNLLYTSQLDLPELYNKAMVIRYPRGNGVMADWKQPFEKIQIGKGRQIIEGEQIAFLTIGHLGNQATKACELLNQENIFPSLYDMRFVKPLDENLLHQIFKKYQTIITIEDGCLQGGFGSAITEFMADNQYCKVLKRIGLPDHFVEQGEMHELYEEYGLSAEKIAVFVRESMSL
jgi:1-deoxy-D-xylulose-5-phosphate synthase